MRQALSKLFNRDAIIRDVYFGIAWKTAGLFIPAFDWLLPEQELNQKLAYDVQGAKQLLQAAGVDTATWKRVLEAGIPHPATQGTAEQYVSELKQVGINTTVKVVDKVESTDRIYLKGETEMCVCNQPSTFGINPYVSTLL